MLKSSIIAIMSLLMVSAIYAEKKLKMATGLTIRKAAVIDATPDKVWGALTTSKGAEEFFAPKASIELAVGGKYELYFAPDQPEGSRGSENCKILSFLPEEMLSFSWNNPPHLTTIRSKHTWVVITLKQVKNKTEVVLTHVGWGMGDEWMKAFQYFNKAWEVVLGRLQYRFKKGPIDWKNPPQLK